MQVYRLLTVSSRYGVFVAVRFGFFKSTKTTLEAPKHQHNIDRETFVEIDGVIQPNVAPRFSRTESKINGPSVINGEHNETALMDWGISEERAKSIF